ncbi:holin [Kitasatospora sp. NPDC127116]|uniref:holin n=1 Tax=Kitasatospora sp. NPDC127116 TaxID=3345367 RepID=UPI003631223E
MAVETKVKAAAAATYVASTSLLAGLTVVQDHPGLVGWLPAWLAPFVLAVVPTAIAGVAGYQAKHTPRPDLVTAASGSTPTEP